MKISGQFYSEQTANNYAVIKSYIETCRRNGINEMQALQRLADGNPYTVQEILHLDNQWVFFVVERRKTDTRLFDIGRYWFMGLWIVTRQDILIHQVTAQISAQRLSWHCSIKIRFTYYHATTSLIVLMVHNDILIWTSLWSEKRRYASIETWVCQGRQNIEKAL